MDRSTKTTQLRIGRQQSGQSLRSVARFAGIDPAYLSRVERGLTTPPVPTMARILEAMGATEAAEALRRDHAFVASLVAPIEEAER